jgi:hypothetical protein
VVARQESGTSRSQTRSMMRSSGAAASGQSRSVTRAVFAMMHSWRAVHTGLASKTPPQTGTLRRRKICGMAASGQSGTAELLLDGVATLCRCGRPTDYAERHNGGGRTMVKWRH